MKPNNPKFKLKHRESEIERDLKLDLINPSVRERMDKMFEQLGLSKTK